MENNIGFDKRKYVQLLKKEEIFEEEGKSFFDENREENLELLSYDIILQNQIYYNRKDEYINLVSKYLNLPKTERAAELFAWNFFNLFTADSNAIHHFRKEICQEGIQRLDPFLIHPKSTDFYDLVEDIFYCCEALTFDLKDNDGINLDQFHDLIEKSFLKMKDY